MDTFSDSAPRKEFITPLPRRNHTACMLNHHMIIYGGIDDFHRTLNDVVALDLKKKKWC